MKKNIRILAAFLITAAALAFAGCAEKEVPEEQAAVEEEADAALDEDDAEPAVEEEDASLNEDDVEPAEEPEEDQTTLAETEDDEESTEAETDAAEETGDETDEGGSLLCFEGTTLDGTSVNTKDLFAENKITLVNIWASWCGPCAMEIPELEKMRGELREKNCGIVGLLIDGEDPNGLADAKDILSDASAQYTNLVFPSVVSNELNLQYVPTTFFVDSKGNILGEPVVGVALDEYLETINSLLSNN